MVAANLGEPFGSPDVSCFMPTRNSELHELLDKQVLQHLGTLGIATVHEYRQWCVDHGFSRGLNKHSSIRAAEIAVRLQRSSETTAQRRRESRNPIDVAISICENKLAVKDVKHAQLRCFAKRVEQASHSKLEPRLSQSSLGKVLQYLVDVRARFLDSCFDCNTTGEDGASLLSVLITLCQYRGAWVRPLEDWRPQFKSARRQFGSLIRHLFDKYGDMPPFMDSAWFAQESREAALHRRWYVHIGSGKNFRTCDLPIPYTNRMAHAFVHAPSDLTIKQALRYGQVLGMNGDDRTARAVINTRLADDFDHDEFWLTFVRWLIAHPMLDRTHVGPLVDYIHHQRFVPEPVFTTDEAGLRLFECTRPMQPNMTLRNRTPESLLRHMHLWHNKLAVDNRVQLVRWLPSDIEPFVLVEGDPSNNGSAIRNWKRWTIRELLSTLALVAEGRHLRHCVASYANSCARRNSSIWTMELECDATSTKLLTIEVQLVTRTIVQVRGKLNRLPNNKEMQIVERWASASKLKLRSTIG